MKNYLLLFVVCLFSYATNAQSHQHSERCGHNILMQTMEMQYPGYKDLVATTFDKAKAAAKQQEDQVKERAVYTIKTVVHLVWKNAEENLDDQVIYDQIAALNEDFRMLNADFSNLRSEYTDIVGDPMIEFELVHIERVQTTNDFGIDLLAGFSDDLLKVTENGGSSPWDTEQYLNIWVCNVQPLALGPIVLGQILGYSFPPVNIADYPELNNWPTDQLAVFQNVAYDGVVIHYPAFGGRGNVVNDPNLGGSITFEGRTTAHEIGHYLGLRHIWGDPDPLSGQDGCTVEDGIDDTPNAADNSQASGCVDTKNTCTDAMDDLPDMWENFMDYSVEACQVAFTQGQIDLIRAVIEGPRAGLLEATGTALLPRESTVKVYPNPTSGAVRIAVSDEKAYQVAVRDMTGRTVMQFAAAQLQNNFELDFSGQSNGVYFVELINENTRLTEKVIVAK